MCQIYKLNGKMKTKIRDVEDIRKENQLRKCLKIHNNILYYIIKILISDIRFSDCVFSEKVGSYCFFLLTESHPLFI